MSSNTAQRCPACDSASAKQIQTVEVEDQHRAYVPGRGDIQAQMTEVTGISSREYGIFRCDSCGLEFCSPFKAPSAEWYGLFYRSRPLYPEYRWEFDYVLDRIVPMNSVGEIGCGSGEFLKRCRNKGVEAFGTDFSQSAVDSCVSQGLSAGLLDIANPAESVIPSHSRHAIVAFQVLEHMDHVSALYDLASEWATADATLWVAVPSDRRPSRYFEERDRLDEPPHHMTRWTTDALLSMGDRCGWSLVTVHYEPLSFSAAVWWWSTRASVYRSLIAKSAPMNTAMERLCRLGIAPYALLRAIWTRSKLSGQSMLAEYRRTGAK
jgi:hypothetical protein